MSGLDHPNWVDRTAEGHGTVEDVHTPWTAMRAGLGRATTTCGALTAVALTVAAVLRALTEGPLAGTAVLVDAPQAVDDVASAAAGVGVLLLAVTLTVAVHEHRSRGLALVLGSGTVLVAASATVAGVLASRAASSSDMFDLLTWRTALAAIAGACLPAVVLAAARTKDMPPRRPQQGAGAPRSRARSRRGRDDAQRSTSTWR